MMPVFSKVFWLCGFAVSASGSATIVATAALCADAHAALLASPRLASQENHSCPKPEPAPAARGEQLQPEKRQAAAFAPDLVGVGSLQVQAEQGEAAATYAHAARSTSTSEIQPPPWPASGTGARPRNVAGEESLYLREPLGLRCRRKLPFQFPNIKTQRQHPHSEERLRHGLLIQSLVMKPVLRLPAFVDPDIKNFSEAKKDAYILEEMRAAANARGPFRDREQVREYDKIAFQRIASAWTAAVKAVKDGAALSSSCEKEHKGEVLVPSPSKREKDRWLVAFRRLGVNALETTNFEEGKRNCHTTAVRAPATPEPWLKDFAFQMFGIRVLPAGAAETALTENSCGAEETDHNRGLRSVFLPSLFDDDTRVVAARRFTRLVVVLSVLLLSPVVAIDVRAAQKALENAADVADLRKFFLRGLDVEQEDRAGKKTQKAKYLYSSPLYFSTSRYRSLEPDTSDKGALVKVLEQEVLPWVASLPGPGTGSRNEAAATLSRERQAGAEIEIPLHALAFAAGLSRDAAATRSGVDGAKKAVVRLANFLRDEYAVGYDLRPCGRREWPDVARQLFPQEERSDELSMPGTE